MSASADRQANDKQEQQQLRQVAAGELHALERLYQAYEPRLQRFLRRMGCIPEEFDEACNETFYVVWKRASSFTGKSRVSTWIFGIARHKAMKLINRRARDVSREQPLAADTMPLAALPEESRLELRQWLEVGLATLPPEQRQVLELAFIEGFSCKEIADVMECPENTVKTRIFHARRKLREILPAYGRARSERNMS